MVLFDLFTVSCYLTMGHVPFDCTFALRLFDSLLSRLCALQSCFRFRRWLRTAWCWSFASPCPCCLASLQYCDTFAIATSWLVVAFATRSARWLVVSCGVCLDVAFATRSPRWLVVGCGVCVLLLRSIFHCCGTSGTEKPSVSRWNFGWKKATLCSTLSGIHTAKYQWCWSIYGFGSFGVRRYVSPVYTILQSNTTWVEFP